MGRPSISEQRRIEIGRALQNCMIKNGSYEATSVKDIAQEAGVATGLVHHYFNSKHEILLLMADLSLLSAANLLEDLLHLRSREDRREKLHELLGDEDQNRFILMLYTLSLSMPEIRELILRRRAELQQTLTARLQRSRSFTGDAAEKAYELMFLLESAVTQSAVADEPPMAEMLARALEAAFPTTEE